MATERDDISDSGVTSLSFSPCEDFYSDFDLQDIKLDEEETRETGSEVQHKLSKLCQCVENKSDKMVLQQAIDLIKHYEMRITGMEATLMNMCQERINQHSGEFLTSSLKNREECSKIKPTTHRVIATISPFSNQQQLQHQQQSSKASSKEVVSAEGIAATVSAAEKLFLESDRLQESGIFDEEFSESDLIERKSTETQTENAKFASTALLFDEYHSDSGDAVTPSSPKSEEAIGTASSGLADELHKLETIKRRIEECGSLRFQTSDVGHDEPTNNSSKTNDPDSLKNVFNDILQAKELSYYKTQYDLLKEKLSAYEANGDSTVKKLTDALTKEHELQNRVEYLTGRIVEMRKEMSRLEEEKCEYEEAENDARLRCQKLEVKLYALVEKKNDIQFQLQQHMRTVSYLRSTLTELEQKKNEAYQKTYEMEMVANEYEERNFELEEREMDVRYRLQILESTVPAVILWNLLAVLKSLTQAFSYLWQPLNDSSNEKNESVGFFEPTGSLQVSSSVPNYYYYYYYNCSCCKTLRKQNGQTKTCTVSPTRELSQKEKLGRVKYDSDGDDCDECESLVDDHLRSSVSSMMGYDRSLGQTAKRKYIAFPFDTTMATMEMQLPPSPYERRKRKRRRVQSGWKHQRSSSSSPPPPPISSHNEEVYLQTLQQADELITSMENDFKRKLQEMENMLTDKHWKLEECERKLATFSMAREIENHLTEKVQNLENEVDTLKLKLKVKEEEKFSWLEKEKCLLEEMEHLNSTLSEVQQNESEMRSKLEEERNVNLECRNEIAFREKEMYDLDCNYTNQIKQLENQLLRAKREIENHEVTNGELKEEVDTLENAIYELNLTLNDEKDEKEKMQVKFRQEMAAKYEEINSLKRLSRDMTAVSAAQEISGLQMETSKSTYNFTSYQVSETCREQDERKPNDVIFSHMEQKNSNVDQAKNTNECYAQVTRYGDQYTITLKSIPEDTYNNFEVIVNNHRYRLRYAYQFEEQKNMSPYQYENNTISLTGKPVLLYEYNGGAVV